MAAVLGIGGFFFRADDPDALADWYDRHFGVLKVPQDYDQPAWQQQAGTTVFAPFARDSGFFGRPEQDWMLNFRVADLDGMVADLRAAGIPVDVDPALHPNGRFAQLTDPEGNPIQLWEPGGVAG